MAECCARSTTISFQRNEKLPGYVGARCALPGLILILHPKADFWSVVSSAVAIFFHREVVIKGRRNGRRGTSGCLIFKHRTTLLLNIYITFFCFLIPSHPCVLMVVCSSVTKLPAWNLLSLSSALLSLFFSDSLLVDLFIFASLEDLRLFLDFVRGM